MSPIRSRVSWPGQRWATSSAAINSGTSRRLPWVGLLLVAALSLPPLLLERPEVKPVDAYSSPDVAWGIQAAVVVVLFAATRVGVWAVSADDPWAIRAELPLVVLAGLMTAFHWHHLDSDEFLADWQRDMYFKIFNHTQEPPHLFRALPYGFVRARWNTSPATGRFRASPTAGSSPGGSSGAATASPASGFRDRWRC